MRDFECTCAPGDIPGDCGHNLGCPVRRQMVGEVVNGEGKLTGVRIADALAMLDLSVRVENSPHLMRLGGPEQSWAVAINTFLDLFDTPTNISELWVWRRFAFAFGRDGCQFSTWRANDALDELLTAVEQIKKLSIEWANLGRLRWLQRRRLARAVDTAQVHLFQLLRELLRNSEQWPDRESFKKTFAGGRF